MSNTLHLTIPANDLNEFTTWCAEHCPNAVCERAGPFLKVGRFLKVTGSLPLLLPRNTLLTGQIVGWCHLATVRNLTDTEALHLKLRWSDFIVPEFAA